MQVGGYFGAAKVAELLQSRGVVLEIVMDEGGTVFRDGMRPFTTDPVAIVGTTEKVCTDCFRHVVPMPM